MKPPLPERSHGLFALACVLFLAACGGEELLSPRVPTRAASFASGTADAGPPIQYGYDEARRLVAVYDATGGSAQYVYDEGGNILEIKRLAATDVGVFDFSPNSGPPGAEVVVTGTGFSATPASNTVLFNGVGATVSAASSQRLVVTVPAGATTGKVSVAANGKTATSHEDFVVSAPAPAPVISGFTPRGGPLGTRVTLTGTGFMPDLIGNRVFFGDVQGHVVSATATQLEATVSRLGSTGRVRVSTAHGNATSADEFLVVPTTELPGSADTRLSAQVGGPQVNISLADATRKAVLTFPVSRGDQVSILVTSVSLGGASHGLLRVYDSAGGLLNTFFVSTAGNAFDLVAAPKTGTYTAVLAVSGSTTGFSASFSLLRALSGTLVRDGPQVLFAGAAGQNGRYSFEGAAGDRLGLGVTSVSTTPSGQSVNISVLKPDGSMLANCSSHSGAGSCNLPVLPAAGTYTVFVDPTGVAATSVGLLLSRTVEGNLPPGAPATTFSTSRVGQDARYTFSASAGDKLTLVSSGVTFANHVALRLYLPNGTLLINVAAYFNQNATSDFTATVAGTYVLEVDPATGNTGQVTLRVVQDASGSAGNIDGPATVVSLEPGQNGRYSFEGTAGDRLGLGVTSVSTTPSGQYVNVSVLKPDGGSLVGCSSHYGAGSCNLPVLPATGTYTVLVDPAGIVAASVGLLLSRTVEGNLPPGAPATTFSTSRVGQDARYTFSASAGDKLTLVSSGVTFANYVALRLYLPNGTLLINGAAYFNQNATSDFTATVAGTYSIEVDPATGNTGQVTLRVVQDASGSAGNIDGPATVVSLEPGQNGRYSFEGTAGDRLGLGVTSVSITPSGQSVNVSVLKPDGGSLVDCNSYSGAGSCNLPVLPATGTYTVLVNPPGIAAASVGLLLSRAVEGSLTVGAPATTFSTSRVGQDARYTFSASAGDKLTLVSSGVTFANYVALRLYLPNGTLLVNGATYVNQSATTNFTATVAGTYSIEVDPAAGNTGQVTLRVVQDASGSAGNIDGPATVVSLEPGQNGRYSFEGAAGDRLGLGVTSVSTTPSGQSVNVSVLKPDGGSLVGCNSYSGAGSCNLPVLPATGTYTVLVDPTGIVAASVGLLLSRTVEGSLTVGAPAITFSTSRVGQDARYTFSASAGDKLTLVSSGVTFANYVALRLYLPNGTLLANGAAYFNQSATTNFTATVAGTYSIEVDPAAGNTGQFTLRLNTQTSAAPAHVEVKP